MTARMPTELACRQMVQLVTDYLEGALSLPDRTRFEQHLLYCDGCTSYLGQMRDVLRTVARIPDVALAADAQQLLLRTFAAWRMANR